MREATPLNAPGPFYVGRDECITCGAPEAEAPMLMAHDEERHSCYFKRQPETEDEIYRALRAMWVSCCGAVRYGGDDPAILERIARMGLNSSADALLQPVLVQSLCLVTFGAPFPSPMKALEAVGSALAGRSPRFSFDIDEGGLSGVHTWGAGRARIRLSIAASPDGPGRWVIELSPHDHIGLPAIGASVDDVLRAHSMVSDIRWYRPAGWRQTPATFQALPI